MLTQEAAESVHEVTRGLQALRKQMGSAPPAVQLTLTAPHGDGSVTVQLFYDGYRDLLSSTVQVRVGSHASSALTYDDSEAVRLPAMLCAHEVHRLVTTSSGLQEVEVELDATRSLVARCRGSFDALMEHYGEHPASANEVEFWREVQTFMHVLSAAQHTHAMQLQVRYHCQGKAMVSASLTGAKTASPLTQRHQIMVNSRAVKHLAARTSFAVV